jgi:hypothetical protein
MRIPLLATLLSMMISSTCAADRVDVVAPSRLFVSGHSLLDQPLPNYLEAIAVSQGTPLQWNRQHLGGSSLRARTRGGGDNASRAVWDGYRRGENRQGSGLDVLAELAAPRSVSGGPYDILLVTEQHWLLHSLLNNDTVRYLRHFHDRLIAANPKGHTWFYEPWLGFRSRSDPASWIAYEQEASPVWQCLVERINVSLRADGRSDRVSSLPAGWALARLIERATRAPGLPGLGSPSEAVDRIFRDNVHLTPAGSYYMALVTYGYTHRRSPRGVWVPPDLDPALAAVLQDAAWEAMQAEAKQRKSWSLAQCQAQLQDRFIGHYWAHFRETYWRRELSGPHAWWRWAKHRLLSHWALRRNGPDNPLRFDPATDAAYWFKAP